MFTRCEENRKFCSLALVLFRTHWVLGITIGPIEFLDSRHSPPTVMIYFVQVSYTGIYMYLLSVAENAAIRSSISSSIVAAFLALNL